MAVPPIMSEAFRQSVPSKCNGLVKYGPMSLQPSAISEPIVWNTVWVESAALEVVPILRMKRMLKTFAMKTEHGSDG